MKKISFTVDRVPPSLNYLIKMHYQERKRRQAVWDLLIHSYWLEHGSYVFKNPVHIVYSISFKSNRRRDYDNYVGGTKFINDSLKRSFLKRDDHAFLKKIEIEFLQHGENQTTINIEEA